jgi:prevent-host-death family protein
MPTVTVEEAKANLSNLIAAALSGVDVIITQDRTPVVCLVPITPVGNQRFGACKGKIVIDARFDEPVPGSESQGSSGN